MTSPSRTRLPDDRAGLTRTFKIKHINELGQPDVLRLYFTANVDSLGNLREVFVRADKVGTLVSGSLSLIASFTSIALQFGVPLDVLTARLRNNRFGPSGFTGDSEFPSCSSPFDLLGQWLDRRFGSGSQDPDVGVVR